MTANSAAPPSGIGGERLNRNGNSRIIPRRLRGDHCQCATCGQYFNSARAFDRHRIGQHGISRRCRSEFEVRRAGMSRNASGWWISSANGRRYSSPDYRSGDRHLTVAGVGGSSAP